MKFGDFSGLWLFWNLQFFYLHSYVGVSFLFFASIQYLLLFPKNHIFCMWHIWITYSYESKYIIYTNCLQHTNVFFIRKLFYVCICIIVFVLKVFFNVTIQTYWKILYRNMIKTNTKVVHKNLRFHNVIILIKS